VLWKAYASDGVDAVSGLYELVEAKRRVKDMMYEGADGRRYADGQEGCPELLEAVRKR
jgi:hypothetical protein